MGERGCWPKLAAKYFRRKADGFIGRKKAQASPPATAIPAGSPMGGCFAAGLGALKNPVLPRKTLNKPENHRLTHLENDPVILG
jgi:hypothetical protein